MPEPLERRHTETPQNATSPDGAASPEDDAVGTRILYIVVAMFLLMFVLAVVGLFFVAR